MIPPENLEIREIVPFDKRDYHIFRSGYWSGYLIRDNHPIAFNVSGTSDGSLYFGGYGNSDSLITYDFTNGGSSSGLLVSGGSFFIGQTVNCANDVVFQQVSVPEPQTLLMLGFGLVGLLGLARRRID